MAVATDVAILPPLTYPMCRVFATVHAVCMYTGPQNKNKLFSILYVLYVSPIPPEHENYLRGQRRPNAIKTQSQITLNAEGWCGMAWHGMTRHDLKDLTDWTWLT